MVGSLMVLGINLGWMGRTVSSGVFAFWVALTDVFCVCSGHG